MRYVRDYIALLRNVKISGEFETGNDRVRLVAIPSTNPVLLGKSWDLHVVCFIRIAWKYLFIFI